MMQPDIPKPKPETVLFRGSSVRTAPLRPPRKHWTKPFLIGVVVAFCVLFLTLFINPFARPKLAGVALLPVCRQPFATVLHESGVVEALNERTVFSHFAGDIVWLADDGQFVEANEPVVRFETNLVQEDIDSREVDLLDRKDDVRSAESDIATLREKYEHLVKQAELTYDEAVLNRKRIYGAPRDDEKEDAELTFKSAKLDLDHSAVDLKNYTELAALGFVSEAQRKQAEVDYATKNAEHARSKAVLQLTLNGSLPEAKREADLAVADAQKQLHIVKFNREADLAVAQANLELAQVSLSNCQRELDRRKQDLEWATVRAPMRGHVVFHEVYKGSSKSMSVIQVGESRTVGQDLCKICDTTALRICVWINECDVKNLALGQHASVRVPALPGRAFEAVVSELAVIATDKNVALSSLALRRAGEAFVNVVQAKLDFINLAGKDRDEIRVGFTADAFIQTSPVVAALSVPWAGVRFDAQGQPFTEVAVGPARQLRALKLGRGDAHRVEVLEGLKEGEQVYDQTGATIAGSVVPPMAYCGQVKNGG